MGTEEFGKPRVPEKHQQSMDTPQNYVKDLWPVTKPVLEMFGDNPIQWPAIMALSIQNMLLQSKDVIDSTIAGQIIMEVAIAMSKLEPRQFGFETD